MGVAKGLSVPQSADRRRASVLMSMGMMMVSPALVALPFKLMLFVLVDGWHLLIGSLAESFY